MLGKQEDELVSEGPERYSMPKHDCAVSCYKGRPEGEGGPWDPRGWWTYDEHVKIRTNGEKMPKPPIGVYNPDGGDMGLPAKLSMIQQIFNDICLEMRRVSEANDNQPTKLCLELPDGIHIFKIADVSEFELWGPGGNPPFSGTKTGERVMYFTYNP